MRQTTSYGDNKTEWLVSRLRKAQRLGLLQMSPDARNVLWIQTVGQCHVPVDSFVMMRSSTSAGSDPIFDKLSVLVSQVQTAKDALVCPRCSGREASSLSFPNDPYPSFACQHCGHTFHQCPVHGDNVSGANIFSIDSSGNCVHPSNVSCTCSGNRRPANWHPHAHLAQQTAARYNSVGSDYMESPFI